MQQSNKIFATIAIAFALLFGGALASASAEVVGMPRSPGELVAKTADGLKALDRDTSSRVQDLRFQGYRIRFVVTGAHSQVPIPSGHDLVFYMRAVSPGTSPQNTTHLYKQIVGKDNRGHIYGTMNEMHGMSLADATPSIPFTATKKGGDIYELHTEDLEPGEYSWTSDGDAYTYSFTVTPQ